MALTDYLLRIPGVRSRVDALRAEAKSEGVSEALAGENEYMFQRISRDQGVYELTAGTSLAIIQGSHRLYQSHGLADFMIQRGASIFLEGGLAYTVTFDELLDDADSETRRLYDDFRRATEKRLEDWWASDDIGIDERSAQFVDELLLSGEHGWRFKVDPSNGFVYVGDLPRSEISDIAVDTFDPSRLRLLYPLSPTDAQRGLAKAHAINPDKDVAYTLLRRNAAGYYEGDAAYHRLRPTPTIRRGRPMLQAIIDELTTEKKFRVLASDRAITRMTTFMQTTLTGFTSEQVAAYAKANGGGQMPTSGARLFVNENMRNEFISANIEAGDVSAWIQSAITVIAASMGWPISWFAYGNDTNRATAETQEDPAYRNLNRQKRQLMAYFEQVLSFVLDSAALHGYLYAGPEPRVSVKGRDEGTVVRKRLRDCATIKVFTRPLAGAPKDQQPLAASTAAMNMLILLKQIRNDYGADVLTPEQIAQILNAGFSADGVGVEVYGDMIAGEAALGAGA